MYAYTNKNKYVKLQETLGKALNINRKYLQRGAGENYYFKFGAEINEPLYTNRHIIVKDIEGNVLGIRPHMDTAYPLDEILTVGNFNGLTRWQAIQQQYKTDTEINIANGYYSWINIVENIPAAIKSVINESDNYVITLKLRSFSGNTHVLDYTESQHPVIRIMTCKNMIDAGQNIKLYDSYVFEGTFVWNDLHDGIRINWSSNNDNTCSDREVPKSYFYNSGGTYRNAPLYKKGFENYAGDLKQMISWCPESKIVTNIEFTGVPDNEIVMNVPVDLPDIKTILNKAGTDTSLIDDKINVRERTTPIVNNYYYEITEPSPDIDLTETNSWLYEIWTKLGLGFDNVTGDKTTSVKSILLNIKDGVLNISGSIVNGLSEALGNEFDETFKKEGSNIFDLILSAVKNIDITNINDNTESIYSTVVTIPEKIDDINENLYTISAALAKVVPVEEAEAAEKAIEGVKVGNPADLFFVFVYIPYILVKIIVLIMETINAIITLLSIEGSPELLNDDIVSGITWLKSINIAGGGEVRLDNGNTKTTGGLNLYSLIQYMVMAVLIFYTVQVVKKNVEHL